jgi:rhodanese-related sulfurtransferase
MPTGIDLAELDRLLASGAQLVEVLPAKDFEEEHLPGAISIPLKKIDETTIAKLDPGRAVVAYCWDAL